jgi:hypothetical protein
MPPDKGKPSAIDLHNENQYKIQIPNPSNKTLQSSSDCAGKVTNDWIVQ